MCASDKVYFCLPFPRPTPQREPFVIAKSDFISCQDFESLYFNGLINAWILLVLLYPEFKKYTAAKLAIDIPIPENNIAFLSIPAIIYIAVKVPIIINVFERSGWIITENEANPTIAKYLKNTFLKVNLFLYLSIIYAISIIEAIFIKSEGIKVKPPTPIHLLAL